MSHGYFMGISRHHEYHENVHEMPLFSWDLLMFHGTSHK